MLGKNKSSASDTDARVKVGTILGDGTVFEGDLRAPEAVRIDGTVNGNCTCEKELIIGKNGHVKGNISAQHVIISGRVEGDIAAQGKLEDALLFCGSNAWRAERIETVEQVMEELAGE